MHRFLTGVATLLALLFARDATALNLLELYEQMLLTNPILKGQESSVDQARAQEDQALSRLLPQVSGIGNINWNDFNQIAGQTSYGRSLPAADSRYINNRAIVQASQALFDMASFLRYQGAGYTIKQSEQELAAAKMSVTADLVDRYLTVLEASDESGYLQGEIALTEGDMGRIRSMFERQMAMVTDLYEVEAYYQTLLTRRIEVDNARAVALEKVRETAGVPVPEIAPLARDRFPEIPGPEEQWVQDAERNHPTLLALQHAAEAADMQVSTVRAQHLPVVSLQMSNVYANNQYNYSQTPQYNAGMVGAQLNLPIYAGGGIEAAAREAEAKYRAIIEKLTEKRRQIDRETRTAWLDAKAGRSRIDSTVKEVDAREKARTAQERSYELGVSTIVALLESKKNLLKSQFDLARARYGYIRALVALRLWAGRLGPGEIEEINTWLAKAPVSMPPP